MTPRLRSVLGLAAAVALGAALSSGWNAWQTSRVAADLAAVARPGDLKMISSVSCGICTQARHWFQAHRVAFDECFIERDRDCAVLFEATRSPGTPVILARGTPVVGFDPVRLRDVLSRSPAPR